jgi:hypothetical protein
MQQSPYRLPILKIIHTVAKITNIPDKNTSKLEEETSEVLHLEHIFTR